MRTSISMARLRADAPVPRQTASPLLRRLAACVFAAAPADEEEIQGFVAAARDMADRDLAFFTIAWSAERIAAGRIAAGDLGIDEVVARIGDCRRAATDMATLAADGEWAALTAEYQNLADELLIDTLNEFREFEMVVAYSGRRDEYAARWAAGMRRLAQAVPEPAAKSHPLPAGRGWRDRPLSLALAG